jgi:hypothetical protein
LEWAKPNVEQEINEEEFIRILLMKICNVADTTHFAAFLYCSQNQQQIFLSHNNHLFTITPLYFQFDPTKPKVPPHFGRGLQYGVLLYLKNNLPNLQFVRHNPLQSNLFTKEQFGKVTDTSVNRMFPFKKNYKVAAHFITMFAAHPDHKILEIFAGSCSSLPAAFLLKVNMQFVDKHQEMYSFYDELFRHYTERFEEDKYRLAPVTTALQQQSGVEEETPRLRATEARITADQVPNIQAESTETMRKVLKKLAKGKFVVNENEAVEINEEFEEEEEGEEEEGQVEEGQVEEGQEEEDQEEEGQIEEGQVEEEEGQGEEYQVEEGQEEEEEEEEEEEAADRGNVAQDDFNPNEEAADRGIVTQDDSNPPSPNPKAKDKGQYIEVDAQEDIGKEVEQPIIQPPPNPSSSKTRTSTRKRTTSSSNSSNPFSFLAPIKKTRK